MKYFEILGITDRGNQWGLKNKEYNISILLNIHHVDLALKYCDRVIGVRAGEIVFDGPASTITQEQIDAVYNGTKVPTMGDGE